MAEFSLLSAVSCLAVVSTGMLLISNFLCPSFVNRYGKEQLEQLISIVQTFITIHVYESRLVNEPVILGMEVLQELCKCSNRFLVSLASSSRDSSFSLAYVMYFCYVSVLICQYWNSCSCKLLSRLLDFNLGTSLSRSLYVCWLGTDPIVSLS